MLYLGNRSKQDANSEKKVQGLYCLFYKTIHDPFLVSSALCQVNKSTNKIEMN